MRCYIFLSVTDVFIKYAWVKPLKDKKAKKVIHGFFKQWTNLIKNQINYVIIKENTFKTALYKND